MYEIVKNDDAIIRNRSDSRGAHRAHRSIFRSGARNLSRSRVPAMRSGAQLLVFIPASRL